MYLLLSRIRDKTVYTRYNEVTNLKKPIKYIQTPRYRRVSSQLANCDKHDSPMPHLP